jgi:hypothetical protein
MTRYAAFPAPVHCTVMTIEHLSRMTAEAILVHRSDAVMGFMAFIAVKFGHWNFLRKGGF